MGNRLWIALVCLVLTHSAGATGKPPVGVAFSERFAAHVPQGWTVADYTASHPWFDTDWRASQAEFSSGLRLLLTPTPRGPKGFAGASVRRLKPTHFGRYEAIIQPARGAGIVTGFFTYTGPYYGTRHDEIDIEFLGKDTTKIHIGVFVDGVLRNKIIDLGFDAADAPRRYRFEWDTDAVRWFVGDEMIHQTTSREGPVPQEPGMVFVNLWAVDEKIAGWAGRTEEGAEAAAKFACVAFLPEALSQNSDQINQCRSD